MVEEAPIVQPLVVGLDEGADAALEDGPQGLGGAAGGEAAQAVEGLHQPLGARAGETGDPRAVAEKI